MSDNFEFDIDYGQAPADGPGEPPHRPPPSNDPFAFGANPFEGGGDFAQNPNPRPPTAGGFPPAGDPFGDQDPFANPFDGVAPASHGLPAQSGPASPFGGNPFGAAPAAPTPVENAHSPFGPDPFGGVDPFGVDPFGASRPPSEAFPSPPPPSAGPSSVSSNAFADGFSAPDPFEGPDPFSAPLFPKELGPAPHGGPTTTAAPSSDPFANMTFESSAAPPQAPMPPRPLPNQGAGSGNRADFIDQLYPEDRIADPFESASRKPVSAPVDSAAYKKASSLWAGLFERADLGFTTPTTDDERVEVLRRFGIAALPGHELKAMIEELNRID